MSDITREFIIDAAKRAAQECRGPLARSDFARITGISQHHIYRLFPEGGWSEIKALAGLERHPNNNIQLADESLLSEFHRVATSLGRIPTWAQFASAATISADVIRRRFSGLSGTLKRYKVWLQEHDPNSPFLNIIEEHIKKELNLPSTPVRPRAAGSAWARASGPEFGSPINFRGLIHAPINEQGVVFLFGMVAFELGFVVEAVHASFPDCEAKRCVDRQRQRWQRVRIEFEFCSSTFRAHGHDPAGCDLIVCWQHDWLDCPIEVLELQSTIAELEE